jgi:uncharacterized membrane protein YjfL (UPF0719 family)
MINTTVLNKLLITMLLLLMAIVVIFIILQFLRLLVDRKKSFQDLSQNPAFATLAFSVLICAGIIFNEIPPPLTEVLRLSNETGSTLFLYLLKYTAAFTGISFLIWMIIIVSSVVLFSIVTRDLNERKEIQDGNWKLSLILSGIIFLLTLVLHTAVADFLMILVPYPDLPRIF